MYIYRERDREKGQRLRWVRGALEKQRSKGRQPLTTLQAPRTTSLAPPRTLLHLLTALYVSMLMGSTISSTLVTLAPWNKPRSCVFFSLFVIFLWVLILGFDVRFVLLFCWKVLVPLRSCFQLSRCWILCGGGVIYGVDWNSEGSCISFSYLVPFSIIFSSCLFWKVRMFSETLWVCCWCLKFCYSYSFTRWLMLCPCIVVFVVEWESLKDHASVFWPLHFSLLGQHVLNVLMKLMLRLNCVFTTRVVNLLRPMGVFIGFVMCMKSFSFLCFNHQLVEC